MGRRLTEAEKELIRVRYPVTVPDVLAGELKTTTKRLHAYASKLGVKLTKELRGAISGRIELNDAQKQFVTENHDRLTGKQMAAALGLKLTISRRLVSDMGFKRFEPEYWTDEQVEYLKAHYQVKGDTELARYFDGRWHKQKRWSKKHIEKKRRQLGLKRTAEQKRAILLAWYDDPRNVPTIVKNSASIKLTDRTVANYMAWRDPERKQLYLQYPALIELKRTQILLNRALKNG